MRKLHLVALLILLTLSGCTKSVEDKVYSAFKESLLEERAEMYDEVYYAGFNIEFHLNNFSDEEITYQVIIDHPSINLENFRAMAIVVDDFTDTNKMFPSVGIFEDPIIIENDTGKNKGVILTGYIPFNEDVSQYKGEIRVLVNFVQNGVEKHVYYRKVYE